MDTPIFDPDSLNDSFVKLTFRTRSSYISTLPNELLLEMFHILTFDVKAPNVTPATLSHVSKQWRNLVMHMPQLWTKILVVDDLASDVTEFQNTIGRVRFFLERSAELAFDLHVELRTFYDDYIMNDEDHPLHDTVDPFRQCTRLLSSFLAPHIGDSSRSASTAMSSSLSVISRASFRLCQ
jgi:F-box-like